MSIQKAIERLMDKMWDQAEDDREFELHDELRTILNMYPEPTVELPASVEPQDSDCASCYTGTDCGMCTTIAPPGETNTAGESLLTSREEAASKAMLWAETMGRSSLDQMAAEGIMAADAVLFSRGAIDRAMEYGLETHDWEMFEAQTGDIADAVADAIRAAIAALKAEL